MKLREIYSLILLTLVYAAKATTSNDELQLKEHLLNSSRYMPSVRPRTNVSEAVEIELTWSTAYIKNLDEKEGLFSQSAILQVDWMDDFLTWNPADYGGISTFVIEGRYIWSPKVSVVNGGNSLFTKNGFSDDLVRVYSNGQVTASHTGTVDVVCTTDAQKFPFDDQTCLVILQAEGYNGKEVKLRFSETGFRNLGYRRDGHPIWTLKTTVPQIVKGFPGDSATIVYKLKRKSLYYSCTMIVPSALLSILTLGAYAIRNDSGEKVSCGLAIFLSFVVFLIQMGDIVPENSNGISLIVTHYMLCMIGSAIFILHSVMQDFFAKLRWSKLCKRQQFTKQVQPRENIQEIIFHVESLGEKSHLHEGNNDVTTKSPGMLQNKCSESMIVLTDLVSLSLCLALNLAGYGLLWKGYNDAN